MNSNQSRENIHVFLRVRPLSSSDKRKKCPSIVDCVNSNTVNVKESSGNNYRNFTFDKVFGPNSRQVDVYKTVLEHMIEEVLSGYNCTVFAYGQTGSGKTYTMEGERSNKKDVWQNDPTVGIVPRCLNHLFDELSLRQVEHTVRVSFMEIYNEELIDLLSKSDEKLKLFEDSSKKGTVIISGLEETTVKSKDAIYKILETGSSKRQTAATLMNASSSRSHTIFTVIVNVREIIGEEEFFRIGKLNLVDLAGSENIGRSGATDKHAREAGNINQSLLTLGRVITALVDRRPHVPYRESKLTRLLQDSLGGRTKTSIIATISPASVDLEETLSTLNYASRAKNIVNKPEANQTQTKTAVLQEYAEELERLRKDLKAYKNKDGIMVAEENYNKMKQQIQAQEQDIVEKIGFIRALEEERNKLERITEELQKDSEERQNNLKIQLEEEKFIVEQHMKTEQQLLVQAQEIQNVAKQAADDTHLLHDKINRQTLVGNHNQDVILKYQDLSNENFKEIKTLMESSVKNQIELLSQQENIFRAMEQGRTDFQIQVKSAIDNCMGVIKSEMCTLQKSFQDNLNGLETWSLDTLSSIKQTINNTLLDFENSFEQKIVQGLNILSEINVQSCNEIKCYESCFNKNLELLKNAVNESNTTLAIVTNNLQKVSNEELPCLHKDIDSVSNRLSKNMEQFNSIKKLLQENLEDDEETLQIIAAHKSKTDKNYELLNSNNKLLFERVNEISSKMEQLDTQVKGHTKKSDSYLSSMIQPIQELIDYSVKEKVQVTSATTSLQSKCEQIQKEQNEALLDLQQTFKDTMTSQFEHLLSGFHRTWNKAQASNVGNSMNTLTADMNEFVSHINEELSKVAMVSESLNTKTKEHENTIAQSISKITKFADSSYKRYTSSGETPPHKVYKAPYITNEELAQMIMNSEDEISVPETLTTSTSRININNNENKENVRSPSVENGPEKKHCSQLSKVPKKTLCNRNKEN